ncbi:uncharacterized protein LOC121579961 isoform X3 [Coregonus clupeaformis]|uniref:uncharacterized protein LOC121579961 isoform X3 n=1 Tax=Coregonus clupeaformis TaxID=59861 RepID=UPI001E1C5964|nr:uncharacterized protein LOC121579961 isoform X3 [Coregonus clupeaformis]
MAPGPAGRDATRRKSKDQLDWSTCWSNSLKEIAGLLPISEPRNGRGLTKKETLVHMLRYFDFLQSKIQTLQSRLPPHCIPKQEPDTGSSGTLWTPSPTQGGHCSVCEDRTGSESSPSGSGVLDTPTTPITGPGSLFLKDQMLGVIPPMRGQREPFLSPAATPQRPILLPLLPLFGTGDSLNLSPSLLTSPARGLSHCLLPEGQEELHVLFEDVWVTPKTTHTKVSCLPCHDPTDSLSEGEAEVRHGRGGWLSSLSEGEEGDITWTPKQQQVPLKSKTSRTGRHCRANASTKGPPRTPLNLKKKCVNGFIMFCRINRKTYLCTHPGTPSTVVTKELASLWHVMPKQERHVYCLKARRFSRQQNRNVRSELVEGDGEEEDCVPSPLHMLLAQRDLCAAARGGP